MNCNLPKITYPTLRTLLLLRIYQAICQKMDVEVESDCGADLKFEAKTISFKQFQQLRVLKQVENQPPIALYRSSIALQLGAGSPQLTEQIVRHITKFFQSSGGDSMEPKIENQLLRDLTVRATDAGLLEFEFSEMAIADWLQIVLQNCTPDSFPVQSNQTLSGNCEIFFCQYSHARCAALLRLANPQNLSSRVIWLRDGNLLLNRERSLVTQIITTLDEWENTVALKNAIALSRAFQTFYQHCQIVKFDTIDCEIMQGRLALVMITHWLLKRLLEQGLGVLAPETL